jgi:hypothetical protein
MTIEAIHIQQWYHNLAGCLTTLSIVGDITVEAKVSSLP